MDKETMLHNIYYVLHTSHNILHVLYSIDCISHILHKIYMHSYTYKWTFIDQLSLNDSSSFKLCSSEQCGLSVDKKGNFASWNNINGL